MEEAREIKSSIVVVAILLAALSIYNTAYLIHTTTTSRDEIKAAVSAPCEQKEQAK